MARTAQAATAQAATPYMVFFPSIVVAYLSLGAGGVAYFQPRYLLPGAVVAVMLLFVGVGRKWAWGCAAFSVVLWAVVSAEVVSYASSIT